MNYTEKLIKQQTNARRIRHAIRTGTKFALCAILAGVLAWNLGSRHGYRVGLSDGVAAVSECETDGGSGYYVDASGRFRCLYD